MPPDAVDWAADHLGGPVVLLGSSQGGVLAMAVEAVARVIVQCNSPASLPDRLRRS